MGFNSGYQGSFNGALTTTIANAATESAVIPLNGFMLAQIILPPAFTGTALTFLVSNAANGTFVPLYDSAGNAVSMTVAQGRAYGIDPALFAGVSFLKIKSGSSEAALRTLILSLRG